MSTFKPVVWASLARRGGLLRAMLHYATLCLLLTSAVLFSSIRPAHAVQAQERLVICTQGDTFSIISLRVFGTSGYARLIAEYNQLPYDTELTSGQVLRIPISAGFEAEFAHVVFAKGSPLVMVRGNRQELRAIHTGDKIYAEDVIKTAELGFVSLQFPSGTLVNVRPDSLVQLVALECLEAQENCVISLDARGGGVLTDVVNRKNQSTELNVNTPHASAAVRGTVFDVDVNSEKMLLGVTDGTVDVTAQGQSTEVLKGLGLRTLAGQPSDPPIRLLPAPDFRRVPLRMTEQDFLSWYPVDNAHHYIIQIARDARGSAVMFNAETSQRRLPMQPLPAGDYFALVRAVDAEQFKGMVNQQALIVAEIDDQAFMPSLTTVDENEQLLLTVADLPDSISSYEVQLSYQQDFRDLSSVDVPDDGGILVAPSEVATYFRARAIVEPGIVGRFGPVLAIPPR